MTDAILEAIDLRKSYGSGKTAIHSVRGVSL